MTIEPDAPGLTGRGVIWADLLSLLNLLDQDGPQASVALLSGAAGLGKTALLTRFADKAAEDGHQVLQVTGDAAMPAAPYAALRILLAPPHTPDLTHLSAPRRQALEAVLSGQEQGFDVLVLRAAVCAAFGEMPQDRPLVLVVDDVDRIDAASFDVLLTVVSAVVISRLPLVALFAARTERVPAELADLVPPTGLRPLSDPEAERLLDRGPDGPAGAARLEIVRRAAGNPLALREYAGWAGDPGEPAPVTGIYTARVGDLPEATRWALTLAAVGERDLTVLARVDASVTAPVWQPAVDAGLVTVADSTVRFRHPLVEYAVLQAAGPDHRARAHRALGAGVSDIRRALWHRAAATEGPDPQLGRELAQAANLLDGAGVVTAVTMLEQAAALMPAELRAPMLLDAAARAGAVGRIRWARDLLDRTLAVFDPEATPGLELSIAGFGAWLETMRGHLDRATDLLVGALKLGPATMNLSNTAAFPAFLLGHGRLTDALAAACAEVPVDEPWAFPLTLTRPGEAVRQACLLVPEADSSPDQARSARGGAAALIVDEPEKALRLLARAVSTVVDGTAAGVHLAAPGAVGWALIDLGRWVEAEQMLVPLLASPVVADAPLIRAGCHAQLAVIAFLRGRPEAAAELIERSPIDPLSVPAFAVRLLWAQGLADHAAGRAQQALASLTAAAAVPHDWQVLVLTDLVAAAAGTPARAEVAGVLAEAEKRYGQRWLSTRARERLSAARALLEDDLQAAAAFLHAPAVTRHPFERATLAAEVGARQRRALQPRSARELLTDALGAFEHLGATGWATHVSAQLREGAPVADPFAGLSPQQEQIVRLAAGGLSNREIGERLFLSPRTIGSHLYRIFPQLGVANRTQLGDLLSGPQR